MTSPVSLSVASGTATFMDNHGRIFTASGFTAEPGDVFGVESGPDGLWFTVGEGEGRKRYPLRHGDDPHLTELKPYTVWSNPFLPAGYPSAPLSLSDGVREELDRWEVANAAIPNPEEGS